MNQLKQRAVDDHPHFESSYLILFAKLIRSEIGPPVDSTGLLTNKAAGLLSMDSTKGVQCFK